MAYNVKWDPYRPFKCMYEAQELAMKLVPQHDLFGWTKGFLYRFEEASYACSDEFGDFSHSYTQIELEAFAVKNWWFPHIFTRPRGATLYIMSGACHKMVNFSHNKKFACPTIGDALDSFIARKTKQARIYRAKADTAERLIKQAQGHLFSDNVLAHT